MNIIHFLFASKDVTGDTSDPTWFLFSVLVVATILLLLGIFGKNLAHKETSKATFKTLKKSSKMLKFFGISYFLLLLFRFEGVKFLSMKIWWILLTAFLVWYGYKKLHYYCKLRKRIRKN